MKKLDDDKFYVSIEIENNNGIEKIVGSDVSLTCNGKQQVALDRELKEGEEYDITVKAVDEEKEENFAIIATAKPIIAATSIETSGEFTTETIDITYPDNSNLINYYSLDDGESWKIYEGSFDIQLLTDEEDTQKTIMAKSEYTKDATFLTNIETQYTAVVGDGLLFQTEVAIKESGNYEITVEDETFNIHAYVYDGDTIFSTSQSFGNANDVATASEYAQNMVVVKVNGDLTINTGVTLTAYGTSYGGPKGMLIYCTGTLTNNGTITMTARGAKAVGQNVYLWKNLDTANNEYEYIPAIGASGGSAVISSSNYNCSTGKVGESGTTRRTGGGSGGSGLSSTARAGADGTSYSGGSGGGGAFNYTSSGVTGIYGGAGGNASGKPGGVCPWVITCGGGAGNPGGSGSNGGSAGSNGTGGTLIMYAKAFNNYGTVSANGSAGGNGYRTGGGGSGGGSINIFYRNTYIKGTITTTGGSAGKGTRDGESANGGAGGSGCISIGNISTGTYVSN